MLLVSWIDAGDDSSGCSPPLNSNWPVLSPLLEPHSPSTNLKTRFFFVKNILSNFKTREKKFRTNIYIQLKPFVYLLIFLFNYFFIFIWFWHMYQVNISQLLFTTYFEKHWLRTILTCTVAPRHASHIWHSSVPLCNF